MSPQNTPAAWVSELPQSAANTVRRGFDTAANLSRDQINFLSRHVLSSFANGDATVDLREIIENFGITRSQASDVVSAIYSLVDFVAETNSTIDEYIEVATGKLFDERHIALVTNLMGDVIQRRSSLSSSVKLASLANQTLPSLGSFDLTVDLRPQFEGDDITDFVPVALLHLGTDSEPEIWLQLSRSDIQRMRRYLDQAERQMDQIENYFQKPKPSDQPPLGGPG